MSLCLQPLRCCLKDAIGGCHKDLKNWQDFLVRLRMEWIKINPFIFNNYNLLLNYLFVCFIITFNDWATRISKSNKN